MKMGEVFVVWVLLTTMLCLVAGIEAVDKSWPMPSPQAIEAAEGHLQQAALDVGFPTAAMVLAIVLAYVLLYVLESIVILLVLVEVSRWIINDWKKIKTKLLGVAP